MQRIDSSMFFYCYDFALHKKLKQARIPYITKAYSIEGNFYWQYLRSDELNKVIKEHSGLKK